MIFQDQYWRIHTRNGPEHVWPALHAFRTSIKAPVGLEVRFDKMQAYNADIEAARREAPADIEWPELDGGHHGIAVLNVPLGSPEYVHAYMRGKAEELREEVDASLSKLPICQAQPSVEAFAEAVDATVLATVAGVLGVSFDPSMYGTDTKPVVTDFLAELLHYPDSMAAEVATSSKDAVARARGKLHLPTRLKGTGIRRMATVRDAAFIDCTNAILPSHAAAVREAWGRLQAATADHLSDADARMMEREAEAVSGSQHELTATKPTTLGFEMRLAIPTARTVMTPHELREVAAG
eukprot:jgi/Tetstr1/443759/TSEL_031747.t1